VRLCGSAAGDAETGSTKPNRDVVTSDVTPDTDVSALVPGEPQGDGLVDPAWYDARFDSYLAYATEVIQPKRPGQHHGGRGWPAERLDRGAGRQG